MAQLRGTVLQDPFLNVLRKERIPVSIFLMNGIKLQGQIDSFDQFVIVLRNSVNQMIYKHAISTIVPARSVRIAHENGQQDNERHDTGRHENERHDNERHDNGNQDNDQQDYDSEFEDNPGNG